MSAGRPRRTWMLREQVGEHGKAIMLPGRVIQVECRLCYDDHNGRRMRIRAESERVVLDWWNEHVGTPPHRYSVLNGPQYPPHVQRMHRRQGQGD